jgi:hypothetical protein
MADERSSSFALLPTTSEDLLTNQDAMRAELEGLKNSELNKRARASGVTEEQFDECTDSDDMREALITLTLSYTFAAPKPNRRRSSVQPPGRSSSSGAAGFTDMQRRASRLSVIFKPGLISDSDEEIEEGLGDMMDLLEVSHPIDPSIPSIHRATICSVLFMSG